MKRNVTLVRSFKPTRNILKPTWPPRNLQSSGARRSSYQPSVPAIPLYGPVTS